MYIRLTGRPQRRQWGLTWQSYEAGGSEYWTLTVDAVKSVNVFGDLRGIGGNLEWNSEWSRISEYISPFKEDAIRNLLWKGREVIIRAGDAVEGVSDENEILFSLRAEVAAIESKLQEAAAANARRQAEERARDDGLGAYVFVSNAAPGGAPAVEDERHVSVPEDADAGLVSVLVRVREERVRPSGEVYPMVDGERVGERVATVLVVQRIDE